MLVELPQSALFLLAAEVPNRTFPSSAAVGIALAAILVLLNAFFVAAEFALVKVRPTQLELHSASKSGKMAIRMSQNLDPYLSACQLGITLASLGLGWIGEPAFARLLDPLFNLLPTRPADNIVHSISLVFAFAFITTVHIVIAEQAPKALAIRRPRATSLRVSLPLQAFFWLTLPAIWALNRMAQATLKLIGIDAGHDPGIQGEEEIRRLLASRRATQLDDGKRELLDNIFELADRNARQVMVPRSDVVYLDTTKSVDENLKTARASEHTRFPLCENDLDHIVGLVHIKDLFRAGESPKSLDDFRRETFFVPETAPLEDLLRRMRRERIHMAAVFDEFGGTAGIVTLENVIEEIVGEIQDEFDSEQAEVTALGDNVFRVLGSTLIGDLEDEIDVDLGDDRDEDTVAGVMVSELGRRPRVGDVAAFGPLRLEVLEVDVNRVVALKITKMTGETDPEPS